MPAVTLQPAVLDSQTGIDSACRSSAWLARDGTPVEIRRICVDDEQRMIKVHQGLSERTVYMRYFESMSFSARTAHARLARVCFADPQREAVLIALAIDSRSGEQKIVGVGRLSKLADASSAEVALLILDEFQGRGIGTQLLRQLIQSARHQRITQIRAEMLRDNTAMQRVLKKFGFRLHLLDPRSVRALLNP